MSYTSNGTAEWRKETGSAIRNALGAIRWVKVTLTSKSLWQVVGHKLLGGMIETHDAAPFTGIGQYARAKAGANLEAVMVFVGGAANPIIIATRDEDMRKMMAQIDQDEYATFNSVTSIIIKKDGTVEICRRGGTPVALATKKDVADLVVKFNAHLHPVSGTATLVIDPTMQAGAPTGTTVLKAQ